MSIAEKYLEKLVEREPQLFSETLKKSPLNDADLAEIEQGLGYSLPMQYRDFLLSYQMPADITVLVSFCGDSFACSWSKTFSREKNGYIHRPEFDIGPTVEFAWHTIQSSSGAEFLKNLQQEQKTQDYCPCFLEAGFIGVGNVYGYLVYLDLESGGIVTIHEEGVYDMMNAGVNWASKSEVRRYMQTRELYICKNFNDFLRLVCTGDYLDENQAKFPTKEELEQDYS